MLQVASPSPTIKSCITSKKNWSMIYASASYRQWLLRRHLQSHMTSLSKDSSFWIPHQQRLTRWHPSPQAKSCVGVTLPDYVQTVPSASTHMHLHLPSKVHRSLRNQMSRAHLLIRRTMERLARAKLRTNHPSRNTLSSPKTIVHLSDTLVASLPTPTQQDIHPTSSHPSGHCSPLMLMDGQLETQTTSMVLQVSLVLSGSMCLGTTDTFVAL